SFTPLSSSSLYILSLHDALPIFCPSRPWSLRLSRDHCHGRQYASAKDLQYYSHRYSPSVLSRFRFQFQLRIVTLLKGQCAIETRSEEHTSELQSQSNLVCRLLLE